MPRKQMADGKSSPAGERPESEQTRPLPRARKSAARSAPVGEGTLPVTNVNSVAGARKAKKTGTSRAVLAPANPEPAGRRDDGFREAVARLAYHFWESRSSHENSPEEDWLRAERAVREVLEKVSSSCS